MTVDLSTDLGGLTLKNPVLTASGTYGCGREYSEYLDLKELGALTTKGVTLEAREGNPPPRMVETPAGILNSIGLQNPGLEYFIRQEMPYLRSLGIPIVVNIAGRRLRDYEELTRRLSDQEGISALEINVSCPNVREGGLAFGTNPRLVFDLTMRLRKITSLPLIVKLTPNVTQIQSIARAAEEGGASAISLINTVLGMEIDIHAQKPVLGNSMGGLSGPAIRPIALRMVYQVYKEVQIPIIGMGGIMDGKDAVAFLLAGASAVAIGTANFVDPQVPLKIKTYIEEYLKDHTMNGLWQIIGLIHKEEIRDG